MVIAEAFYVRGPHGEVIALERPIEAVGGTVEAQDDGTILVWLRDRRYLIGPNQPLADERVDMHLEAPVFWGDGVLYGRMGTLWLIFNDAIGVAYWEVKNGAAYLDLKR